MFCDFDICAFMPPPINQFVPVYFHERAADKISLRKRFTYQDEMTVNLSAVVTVGKLISIDLDLPLEKLNNLPNAAIKLVARYFDYSDDRFLFFVYCFIDCDSSVRKMSFLLMTKRNGNLYKFSARKYRPQD